MNELLGLLLVVTGIIVAKAVPRLLATGRTEGAEQDEAGPWLFAAGLGLVLTGLAALNIEPRAVLLALVVMGTLLSGILIAIGFVLDRAGRRRNSS